MFQVILFLGWLFVAAGATAESCAADDDETALLQLATRRDSDEAPIGLLHNAFTEALLAIATYRAGDAATSPFSSAQDLELQNKVHNIFANLSLSQDKHQPAHPEAEAHEIVAALTTGTSKETWQIKNVQSTVQQALMELSRRSEDTALEQRGGRGIGIGESSSFQDLPERIRHVLKQVFKVGLDFERDKEFACAPNYECHGTPMEPEMQKYGLAVLSYKMSDLDCQVAAKFRGCTNICLGTSSICCRCVKKGGSSNDPMG
eukprot:gnl/TRDRNA2_/TRDRNA2_188093_c0_seq1.p1 gnl/TRDRNA2_/TRDRNA2_188093_c0~~gnl/TRDRNA2_/TRDRNA2_188093_c0_seq1.p1  ORF type:complete len:261 (-),score=42.22 gnl/TRDRNA2_/TRDRNA2_188093_c0_seq1:38-820(-)